MKRWITFVALAAGIIKAGMAAELWVGAAEADITPDQPVALTGGRTGPISRGVNSRISANVLAIEAREGDRATDAAILVACDVCSIRTGIQARFRELVAPRLKGFDINKLILTATHTHKGPALDQANYDSYEGAMQPDEYVPFMFERMADAVVRAWESRQRGSLAWGLGYAMVAQNRRAVYANGSAEMYGRTDRAECRGLEGYSDHAVDSLFFLDEAGAMKAIAVTVPCPASDESDSGDGAVPGADRRARSLRSAYQRRFLARCASRIESQAWRKGGCFRLCGTVGRPVAAPDGASRRRDAHGQAAQAVAHAGDGQAYRRCG